MYKWYFVCLGIMLIAIGICLMPNGPRIIINRPSLTEVEPDIGMLWKTTAVPVRRSLGIFIVTAYCPNECCCGRFADGITANGHRIQFGDRFCAADIAIPFGKYLDIPGYGYVPVWDRGGEIKGNKLDVFFDTHQEALKWGNQKLEIFCWVEGE